MLHPVPPAALLLVYLAFFPLTTSAVWLLAAALQSCSSLCESVGQKCTALDFHAHKHEVDSSDDLDELMEGFNFTCQTHKVSQAKNAPNYRDSTGACTRLGLQVEASDMDCNSHATMADKWRICWCTSTTTITSTTLPTSSTSTKTSTSTSLTSLFITTSTTTSTTTFTTTLTTTLTNTLITTFTTTVTTTITTTMTTTLTITTTAISTTMTTTSTTSSASSASTITYMIATTTSNPNSTTSSTSSTNTTSSMSTATKSSTTTSKKGSSTGIRAYTSTTASISGIAETSTTTTESKAPTRTDLVSTTLNPFSVNTTLRDAMANISHAATTTSVIRAAATSVANSSTGSSNGITSTTTVTTAVTTTTTASTFTTAITSIALTPQIGTIDTTTTIATFTSTTHKAAVSTLSSTTSTVHDHEKFISSAHAYEDSLVQQLRADNATSKVTRNEGDHAVLVAQLKPSSSGADKSFLNFSMTGSEVQVSIPASLALVSGDAVVVLGVFSNDSTPLAAPVGASLVGPAVNIRLLDLATGFKIPGTEALTEKIVFRLMSERPQGAVCMFWDETLKQWSTAGVQTLDDPGGEFWCSTTHLTLFAGIITSIGTETEKLVMCANVQLLERESLENILRGDWWKSGAAILLWILLFLQTIMLLLSCFNRSVFKDSDFLTSNEVYRQPIRKNSKRGNKCSRITHCCYSCLNVFGSGHHKLEKLSIEVDSESEKESTSENVDDSVSEGVSDRVLNLVASTCARPILARQSQISPSDLGKLSRPDLQRLKSFHSIKRAATSKWSLLSSRGRSVTRSFSKSSLRRVAFLRQVWMIYGQVHPWALLLQNSVTTTPFMRSLILTSKLLGSLMLSALFFLFEDGALGHKSPETCSKATSIQGKIIRNMLLGLVSLVLGTVPLIFLLKFQRRRFVYRRSWASNHMRIRYLGYFCFKSFAVISLCTFHCLFSILFVLSFLANVTSSVASQWLIRAATILGQEMLGAPFGIAVMYSIALSIISRLRPNVIDRVHLKLVASPGGTPVSASSRANIALEAETPSPASSRCKESIPTSSDTSQSLAIHPEKMPSEGTAVYESCKLKRYNSFPFQSKSEPEGEPDLEEQRADSIHASSGALRDEAAALHPVPGVAVSTDSTWLCTSPDLGDGPIQRPPPPTAAWSATSEVKQMVHPPASTSAANMSDAVRSSPQPPVAAPPEVLLNPPAFPGELQ